MNIVSQHYLKTLLINIAGNGKGSLARGNEREPYERSQAKKRFRVKFGPKKIKKLKQSNLKKKMKGIVL